MYWTRMLLLLFIPLVTTQSFPQETEEAETTTLESNNVSDDVPSSSESQVQLDSSLRDALLKALSELEGDDSGEPQALESYEKNVERAQASAVTYVAKDEEQEKVVPSQDQQPQTATKNENQISQDSLSTPEDTLTEKADEIFVQKSNGIQSGPISAIEKEPLDFFKDAEQIITSASNSFLSDSVSSHTPRSVQNAEFDTKTTGFSNINTISDFDSTSPSKEVEESPFVKTYVRPLGNFVTNDIAYVKPTETFAKSSNGVNSKSSVTSEAKLVDNGDSSGKSNGNSGNVEATTVAAVEVSTEENEAKVEQVQFFSAPLVAAFTVHQDEKGQPKKVEPIFKNELNPKKTPISGQQNIPQQNTNLQSSTFNNLDLQKKQQILEQELEKLRNQQLLQQQSILSSNVGKNPGFNGIASNNVGFTESGFNQAVTQNFNQFDPIFTEPDRSIVTKLATIDPNTLLAQNGGLILNKFTPNDAILPVGNPAKPSFANKIVPDSKPGTKGDVSLISSISYDPIIEAGKLPLNAQILPNKEPTGFLNFVPLSNIQNQPQIQNSVASQQQGSSNFAQSSFSTFNGNSLAQTQQRPAQSNQNFLQPTSGISNFASSGQSTGQTVQNSNFLVNQAVQTGLNPSQSNRFVAQGSGGFGNNQFLTSNRILRQEQGSGNLGLNQNTFSIIQSQQPFNPIQETSYFPESNKNFGRQSPQDFQGAQNNFFNGIGQNQNRFFKSNLEGTVASPNNFNIQQSVQPFGQQVSNNNLQNNKFFRSNQEGTFQNFGSSPNVGFSQQQNDNNNRFLRSNQESTFLGNQNRFSVQPTIQNYKYSSSFGFPTIPLNKK